MCLKQLLPFIFCLSLACEGRAQMGRMEELKKVMELSNPSARLGATLDFCGEWDSYSPDTLIKYAKEAKRLALLQKDTRAELVAGFYQAAYLFQKNQLDTALKLVDSFFTRYKKETPYDAMYLKFYRMRGNIFLRTTRFDECLKSNFEELKQAEEQHDTFGMASATMGVGNVHNRLQEKEDALVWYYKALDLVNTDSLRSRLSFLYNNIAIVHYKMGHQDSMFFFIKKGLQYSKQSGNLTDYANALFLNAGMLAEAQNLPAAETAFKDGLEQRRKIGDIYYIIADMAQIALFYLNSNQTQKGIDICLEGIALAKQHHYDNIDDLYASLARNYKAAGKYQEATQTLEQYLVFKDSIYQKNSAEALAELETRYELQKKENTIIRQQYDLSKKNQFIYGVIGLLAITLLAGYFFLMNRRKNQRLKMQAFEMEQKRKTTVSVMQAEEGERKRIAGDLHDSVAQKMVVAKLNLEALGNELPDLNIVHRQIYTNIHTLLAESATEVRELSHSIMPQAFSRSGLTDAVSDLLEKIDRRTLMVNLGAHGDFKSLDENIALMLYRVIQECVQNVLKHAVATRLDISMNYENREIDITIEDNGKGFDSAAPGLAESVGMKNIHSRMAYLNGKVEISSSAGRGTLVALYVPLNG